jgi:hypothetical protein
MNNAKHARHPAKKLALHRETLRRLSVQDLAGAHGGRLLPPAPPPTPGCPTRPTTLF